MQFRNAIQHLSIQAKSKIERKFQEHSEKTLRFERIPRDTERTLEFDFLAKNALLLHHSASFQAKI